MLQIINLGQIIKYFLYIIAIFFTAALLLLYTASGNRLLLPHVSDYLTKKLNDKIQVKVTNMSLSLPQFKLRFSLNDITKVETKGTFNPFTKNFKLGYKLITPNIICKKRAMGRDFYLKGEANGTMEQIYFSGNGKIFSSKDENTLATIKLEDGNINKSLKTVKCNYQFKVADLAKMTRDKYNGKINVLGKILYHKGLQITGGAEDFGGYAHFHYQNDKAVIKLNALSAQKLLYLLNYPATIDAKINGDIEYHLTNETSTIDLGLKDINFVNCITTQNLYNVLKIDIRKSAFDYGLFLATTDKDNINCDFKIQKKNSHLYITNTKINQKENKINALFDMKMQNQEFSGKLYGNLYEPNIKINMGALFVFKVKQMINPATGFDMKSKFDCIKGVADGLFGGFF